MNAPRSEIEQLIARAEADPMALSHAELARLDALLAADSEEVLAIGNRPASPAADLQRAIRAADGGRPTPAAWNAAWSGIEQALDAAESAAARPARAASRSSGALRLWRAGFAAVAAALLLAVYVWSPRSDRGTVAAGSENWPIVLATDVEIHDLAVSDGTPFVVSVGGSGAEVIWVLETPGG